MSFNKSKMIYREFFAFAWVGIVGFIVDATILTILVTVYDWSSYAARLISFSVAVWVTWFLNRHWTFRARSASGPHARYTKYFTIQAIGALINYGIFAACIYTNQILASYPIIPLGIGSAVAMIFNFGMARMLVFTGMKELSET